MVDVRITLSGLWVAVMLTHLLGDVLIPIIMLVLCLTLPYPAVRWVVLVAAASSVVFNLAGLPYEGAYDNFLIGVSIVLCGLIGWYAWTWPTTG